MYLLIHFKLQTTEKLRVDWSGVVYLYYQLGVRIWIWSSAAWPLASQAGIFRGARFSSLPTKYNVIGQAWQRSVVFNWAGVFGTDKTRAPLKTHVWQATGPPTFLYLSFSTLYSSSLWRTDTIVFSKISPPVSITPPPSNELEINDPEGLNRGFTVFERLEKADWSYRENSGLSLNGHPYKTDT